MFTIMTWNVENLFEPAAAQRAACEAKLDALAAVILAAAPDLLAVQEVGDPASFEALRERLGPAWTGVLSSHYETPHTIRVGWLSPQPLTDIEEITDLPAALAPVKVADDGAAITQLGRGALAVTHTTAGGTRVRALTAHLKSKLLSFPRGRFDTDDETERARYAVYALNRRAAEAAALRDWATHALAGDWAEQPVIVCGDLNDTPEAATTQPLFGPPGSQHGTGGFDHPDKGDPQRLWGLGYWMTPPDNYSRIKQGRRELIDHLLVSHILTSHVQGAAAIPLDVPSIGLQPATSPRVAPAPSDHRPVIAHLGI